VDDIDDRLSRLFESAAAQVRAPVEEILETSTALGRRRGRRQSFAMAAAVVGTIALTAGAVLGLQKYGTEGGDAHTVAAAVPTRTDAADRARASAQALHPPPSAADSTTGTSTTAAEASAAGAASGATAPRSGAALLTQLLAGYGTQVERSSPDTLALADVVGNDGHGDAETSIRVETLTPELLSQHVFTCTNFIGRDASQRPPGAPAPSCVESTTSDGRTEYVIVTADDAAGFYDYEVTLYVTDNLIVSLESGNGVALGATVDVTRDLPPLTLAQMEAIVADPAWPGYAAAP
jgi:hypothetical protein